MTIPGYNINTSDLEPYEPGSKSLSGEKIHAQHEFVLDSSQPSRLGVPNPKSTEYWCCYCAKDTHDSWDCWSTTTFLCNCGRCVQHQMMASTMKSQRTEVRKVTPIFKPVELLRKSSVNSTLIQKLLRRAGVK